MSELVSTPALDSHETRRKRFRNIASYQFANTVLSILLVAVLFGWGSTIYALHENSKTIKKFGLPLLPYQNLNSSRDQVVIRSALANWAQRHLSRMRATISDEYPESFLWMDNAYAAAIRANDDKTKWLEIFLKDRSQPEYKLRIANVVIESTKNDNGATTGSAKIYGWTERYGPDGIPYEHDQKDNLIIDVRWGFAANVPNDVQIINPLGVAVLPTYTVSTSLE